jgi:hypothetical protein
MIETPRPGIDAAPGEFPNGAPQNNWPLQFSSRRILSGKPISSREQVTL